MIKYIDTFLVHLYLYLLTFTASSYKYIKKALVDNFFFDGKCFLQRNIGSIFGKVKFKYPQVFTVDMLESGSRKSLGSIPFLVNVSSIRLRLRISER